MTISSAEKKELLVLARSAIIAFLSSGADPVYAPPKNKESSLLRKAGVFVTLHKKKGGLRGCIGQMFSEQPLYKTVIEMAREAAFDDPRFTALTKEELAGIKIEISVLSPLKKIADVSGIELGKHGVLVKKGPYSGVFLPQVAGETGWTLEEFMNNLCAGKAGLPADAWKNKNLDIFVFTVELMSE